MKLVTTVSAGWLAVLFVGLGHPQLAVLVVTLIGAYAFWPERCSRGHAIACVEAQGRWSPWRCVRCHRLRDDVRPDWQAASR